MRDERLTIMDLPKTKKQIEENNKLSNRAKRLWMDLLNEFFQPEKPFNGREAALIGVSFLAVILSAAYMILGA